MRLRRLCRRFHGMSRFIDLRHRWFRKRKLGLRRPLMLCQFMRYGFCRSDWQLGPRRLGNRGELIAWNRLSTRFLALGIRFLSF